MEKKRPVGLMVFAIINFIFSGFTLLGFVMVFAAKGLMAQSGVSLNAYSILSPLITSIMLILTGIGFIKMNYILGFIGGLILCIGSLLNIIVYNALQGFKGFAMHIPSMIYPVILLLFLVIRYKQYFICKKDTEQSS